MNPKSLFEPTMPLRTYRRIKHESDKGKAKRLEFEAAERRVLKRAKYVCEVKMDGVCTSHAVTAHHRKLRSQGGNNSEENLLAVCIDCHEYLHAHPAVAYEIGAMIRK